VDLTLERDGACGWCKRWDRQPLLSFLLTPRTPAAEYRRQHRAHGLCAPCGLLARQPEEAGPYPSDAPAFSDLRLPSDSKVFVRRTQEAVSSGPEDAGTFHTVEWIAWLPSHREEINSWPIVGWPHWPAAPGDPARPTLRFGRVRVYLANSSIFLEAAWHPERDGSYTYTLRGLEQLQRQEELSDAWRGERLLRHYAPTRPGRPPGGALDVYSLEDLRGQYRDLVAEHLRDYLKPPAMWQFAARLGVDRKRVRERIQTLGYHDWKDFLRDCQ
jgi:hypothetical protein